MHTGEYSRQDHEWPRKNREICWDIGVVFISWPNSLPTFGPWITLWYTLDSSTNRTHTTNLILNTILGPWITLFHQRIHLKNHHLEVTSSPDLFFPHLQAPMHGSLCFSSWGGVAACFSVFSDGGEWCENQKRYMYLVTPNNPLSKTACFNGMMGNPNLYIENGWKSPFPSIHSKLVFFFRVSGTYGSSKAFNFLCRVKHFDKNVRASSCILCFQEAESHLFFDCWYKPSRHHPWSLHLKIGQGPPKGKEKVFQFSIFQVLLLLKLQGRIFFTCFPCWQQTNEKFVAFHSSHHTCRCADQKSFWQGSSITKCWGRRLRWSHRYLSYSIVFPAVFGFPRGFWGKFAHFFQRKLLSKGHFVSLGILRWKSQCKENTAYLLFHFSQPWANSPTTIGGLGIEHLRPIHVTTKPKT